MITKYPFVDKTPPKLGDPGKLTVSCSIGNIDINNALCNIGAELSVMPLTLYRKLNLGECIPTGITLQMADKSTKKQIGAAKAVLLRLDGHVIPNDFIILDMPKDEKYLLFLGDHLLIHRCSSGLC